MGHTTRTSSHTHYSLLTNMFRLLLLLAIAKFSTGLRCLSCGSDTVECPRRHNVSIGDVDCEDGWCETEFRRGSDVPASLRCIKSDPTQEKVTRSPYALINKERDIWCQWPAFGQADVRCVCKGRNHCNNLAKPGSGNRNSGSANTRRFTVLAPLLPSLLLLSYLT